MIAHSESPMVSEVLHALDRRRRWKRWLTGLQRLVVALFAMFVLVFLADWTVGLNVLAIRVASLALVVIAGGWLLANTLTVWLAPADPIGLAQLLEEHYPRLSERLLTLVQVQTHATTAEPQFVQVLQTQTEQRLANVDLSRVCPYKPLVRNGLMSLASLVLLLPAFLFVPTLTRFNERFLSAWFTSLVPFEIELAHGNGFVVRGDAYAVKAVFRMLDPHAIEPQDCALIVVDGNGVEQRYAMTRSDHDQYAHTIESLRESVQIRVEAGGIASEPVQIAIVEPPVFAEKPVLIVSPPSYLVKQKPEKLPVGVSEGDAPSVLQYSKMDLQIALDRKPVRSMLSMKLKSDAPAVPARQVQFTQGKAALVADACGIYECALHLTLEHDLSVTLPVGIWRVHPDTAPLFRQPLHIKGASAPVLAGQSIRVAADDAMRLRGEVTDAEGIGAISLELRVNDDAPKQLPWLDGRGAKSLTIDHWLPIPKNLRANDRVQFRVHASDNRRLKIGEVVSKVNSPVPSIELYPQTVTAPADEGSWITLEVDKSIESLVKQQAETQRAQIRDAIAKFKSRLAEESQQIDKLKRTVHQQSALTPEQRQQASKLRALNRSIADDLRDAGRTFGGTLELADLASHFGDIANNELGNSDAALGRFSDKDRTQVEGEKALQAAQSAVDEARKRLDRMLEWNDRVAQDRLDQWQIDKMAKQQQELADKLEQLNKNEKFSDTELAKAIEEIRQEQSRLAAQLDKLKQQNQLVRDSLAAMERMQAEKLANAAKELATEQRGMSDLNPETMPAELKARLEELARRQADLAKRVSPFAADNGGPDVSPANDAAEALKKAQLESAIKHQREHEARLRTWLGKLLPGAAVNELREQMMHAAQEQKKIAADLERLGRDLPRLDEKTIQSRLQVLLKRQRDLSHQLGKVEPDRDDKQLQSARQTAVDAAKQAGDQLAVKDALQAFQTMEKSWQAIEALAATLPKTLVKDRSEIKDQTSRDRIERIEQFAVEQERIRLETQNLLADWMKSSAGKENAASQEKMEKLAKDLLELSQKATSPEAKAMAKESAQAVEMAKKSMEASKDAKQKGDAESAKTLDDEAAKKLDFAFKQMQKLAQDTDAKGMDKTADAVKQSQAEMKIAEANLPKMPKDAKIAMQNAADKLAQAAQQASQQSTRRVPQIAQNPATKANPNPGSGNAPILGDPKLESFAGKSWGELPGELKTQLIQDLRARYGVEYAELISQYFDRLAQTPRKK